MKKLLLAAALSLVTFADARVISNVYDLRFVRADVNSDVYLSFSEFLGTQNGLTRQVDAAHRFNVADVDDDGRLSITEFRNSRGGSKGGRAARYESFLLADQNGDGVLSPEEYALTEPQSRAPRLVNATFGRKDKNGDAVLTPREFGILVIPR